MTMKNVMIDGYEFAPECCIVCGAIPDQHDSPGWSYLIGTQPISSMTCSPKCFDVAMQRHNKTGRVDTPKHSME